MILAFIVHALACACLAAAAAWLVERALAAYARPRRLAWVFGFACALVPLAAWLMPAGEAGAAVVTPAASELTAAGRAVIATYVTRATEASGALPPLDSLLGIAWALGSAASLVYFVLGWWRLARAARAWRPGVVESHRIDIADDLGPAVFGVFRSRIVFPLWLLETPAETQALALRHEREHIAARDPQLLALAMLAVLLTPWNLPLLWMLRRLRFALEVDCDARVVRHGADSADYGLALLAVSERQRPAPFAAVALIERPSQLERRINIMLSAPRKLPVLASAASLLLAASCLFAATQIDVPASLAAPLKPTPSGELNMKLGRHFERVLLERFPGFLDEETTGTKVVVVRLNRDWSIDKAAKVLLPESPENSEISSSLFKTIGLKADEVPYLAITRMQSPTNPANTVTMAYTERPAKPGGYFVSYLFPDTRPVDREIFRRHFPDNVRDGVPADAGVWVLLDREGHVLRNGIEAVPPPDLRQLLEAKFPGIHTEVITYSPIVDAANEPVKDLGGKNLQLISVWLAPGSPQPAS